MAGVKLKENLTKCLAAVIKVERLYNPMNVDCDMVLQF